MLTLEVELLPSGEVSGEVRYVKSRAICSYAICRAEQRRAYGPAADGAAGGVFKSRSTLSSAATPGWHRQARTLELVGQQKHTGTSSAEQRPGRETREAGKIAGSTKAKTRLMLGFFWLEVMPSNYERTPLTVLISYTSTDTRERTWGAPMRFLRLSACCSEATRTAEPGREKNNFRTTHGITAHVFDSCVAILAA